MSIRLVMSILLAVVGLTGATASSASAFGWWVENEAHEEVLLNAGEKQPFNEVGEVVKPFVIKWNKEFEITCSGVAFAGGFIEGTVKLGMESLKLKKCAVTKPLTLCTLVSEEINTSALLGEIRKNKSNIVEFTFVPKTNLGVFTLTGALCAEAGKKVLKGSLKGELPEAEKLSTKKDFVFKENKEQVEVEGETTKAKDEAVDGDSKYSASKGWSAR